MQSLGKGLSAFVLPSLGLFGKGPLHLEPGTDQACGQSFAGPRGRDGENGTKVIARVCWNCFSHQVQLEIYSVFNTRISVQLRFAQDKFTVPLFYAASKRHCIWKRQGKNNSCTPKSLSLSRFSNPLATACVVGALVSSFSGVSWWGCDRPAAVRVIPCRCGAVCPENLQNILPSSYGCGTGVEDSKALACGTGAVWYSTCGVHFLAMRMPLLCKKTWDGWTPLVKWWDRSLHTSHRVHSTRHPIRSDLHWPSPNWCLSYGVALLKCGLHFSISGRSVVSATNLDREVKRHGHFEKRPGAFGRVFNTWERVFVRYDIEDLLCIHHHLDVARQLHQEMAIFDEYLVSSKVRMCNTPKFPSLSSPALILKGFWLWDQDARILPCTMFRGPSAGRGRSVVSANNLDREVKGHGKLEHRPGSFGRIFSTREMVFVRYDIDQSMIYYVSIITLTWRDSCIKRWQFSTSTSFHPKFECATLPNFHHFRHLHSSWKGFDSGIRMQGYCLVQCSGVRQQFLADQWSVQTIWIARWKGMESLNIGRDLSEGSSTPGKGFLWDMISMIYYVSIITLTWRDSCIKRWQFSTSTSFHPKFECATLPNFHHFRHLHSSWKGFDSGIRMQGYCLVQCSGVHQQVVADQWSVQTIWIARWKGMESLNIGRDLSEESSAPGKWYLWDMISINRWSIMYPSSPWRGETAASRDGNFRRLYQQHSQISITFITFTHPERVLILGSGCKDIALYNVQGSVSSSWQISGQCKQSGSQGEKAWQFWEGAGSFRKRLQKLAKGICKIWYRWSTMYPSLPWCGETAASRDGNFWRVPCIIQSSNEQHSQVSVTFVTFTHPERVLILGSGCRDIALYNVQGSVSSSWQISGQCKQSGSQGEKAWQFWKEAGSFRKSLQKIKGICEIWYRWSTMYPSLPWRG